MEFRRWREQLRKNKLPRLWKKKYWTSFERFTSVTCVFHFWIGSQSEGITFNIQFFQVQLDWSRRNLSLPIKHLFRIRFRQSARWLSLVLCTSAWPSLCTSILVFFSIFKLIVFSMLNENFFVTCEVKRWRKLEIVAVSFSSSWSLLSLHAHKCIYESNWTWCAKGVQARISASRLSLNSFICLTISFIVVFYSKE